MDWFHEHPSALVMIKPLARVGSGEGGPSDATVQVASLLEFSEVAILDSPTAVTTGAPAWRHFMQGVVQCFCESRGPLTVQAEGLPNSGAEADGVDGNTASVLPNEVKEKPLKAFARLFDTMLKAPSSKVDIGVAFRMTQYVCERVEPDAALVLDYLKRLVEAFTQHPPKDSDREIAAAAVLLRTGCLNVQSEMFLARVTRGDLLRVGADLKANAPDMNLVRCFARLLGVSKDFDAVWAAVGQVRTPQEEVHAYHLDTREELAETDYPFLSNTPEWDYLKHRSRRGIHIMSRYSDVCPFCFNMLPTASASQLQKSAITSHCGKILLCEEL
jgi:hypothetical protein